MKRILYIAILLLAVIACEKMVVGGEDTETQDINGNVILKLSPYTTESFTRGTVNAATLCSRFNVGIFDEDGANVKKISQKVGDNNYGTISLSLATGTYTIVAYGHNKEKSVTANSMTDISFSGGPSDVFLYYGTIDVTEEPEVHELSMHRVVGMFRLILTDDVIPDGVSTLSFTLSGGSIHLNPSTGSGGTTQSPQKTDIAVVSNQNTYDVYTFPQSGGSVMTIIVTAKTDDGTIIATKVFDDVPININEITSYRGKLFDGVTSVTASSLGFTADPDWIKTNEYDF